MVPYDDLSPNINTPSVLFQSFLESTLVAVSKSVSGGIGHSEQSPSMMTLFCLEVFLVTEYFLPAMSRSIVNDQSSISFFESVSPLFAPKQKCMISIRVDFPRP